MRICVARAFKKLALFIVGHICAVIGERFVLPDGKDDALHFILQILRLFLGVFAFEPRHIFAVKYLIGVVGGGICRKCPSGACGYQ